MAAPLQPGWGGMVLGHLRVVVAQIQSARGIFPALFPNQGGSQRSCGSLGVSMVRVDGVWDTLGWWNEGNFKVLSKPNHSMIL